MPNTENDRELERERKLERERSVDVVRSFLYGVDIHTHRVLMRIINTLQTPPQSQPPQPEILERRIEEISCFYGPTQLADMFQRVASKMRDAGWAERSSN